MQTTNSKLYQFLILCRGIGAAASMLALFANGQTAQAADGDLDPSFGFGGKAFLGSRMIEAEFTSTFFKKSDRP